ncbi:RNA 3'-terminal phosphate cyclase [Folsomia candida]|uniref:RNA 3'-terminal phosphate cyclase n=1 Tax=Folsomia candida TaxID=158441 RepID=UPI000B8F9EBD|nr:RNA 3'-terminal phosphate cyclase [Folsomia candida]
MSETSMNPGKVLVVDGSHGEGGGQIIRNAVTLSCILKRDIKVINIRANRPNPGLASQHLESILAMLRISGATTSLTPKKQDTSFDLNGTSIPRVSSPPGVNTNIDLKTAGSCTLCIQCILPFLMTLATPSRVTVIGGTHVMKSPSFDYLQRVFLPTFNLLGNDVKAWLRAPGYFPRGGGRVELEVNPNGGKFVPFNLTEKGSLVTIEAILNVTPKLEKHLPEFRRLISEKTPKPRIEFRILSFASVEYFVTCEKSRAGFSYLVEGRNPEPDQVFKAITTVQKEVEDFLVSSAAVDTFLADQLIIYTSLAKLSDPSSAESRLRTVTLSDHTTSAIHVAQLFSPQNKFQITKREDGAHDIVLL